MKPDPVYLRGLLDAIQSSPSPWPRLSELGKAGIEPDDKMLFHLQLLNDDGFIQSVDADEKFGFVEMNEDWSWMDRSIRLTARGHEFIEALNKQEVWDVIKSQFPNASLKTIFQIGRSLIDGYARKKIEEYAGEIKL